ncbi:uncharacterized protein LOC132312167 [Cornus florida]|uniref:uncharacterized protein LOC132312167 n=1 Tax=Cornus florida TaxID=4283 RepID=UPI00289D7653|nr:uncharacterized protein LOC132312167 [Cornus florida]XP_059666409.1 uncharacterized protein LOC132312167 [Cornus florida]
MLREPALILGREFPRGMAFFSFGSRIYMLGSISRKAQSSRVVIYDTVSGCLGVTNQHMHTPKYGPIVIQPLKPFDDRVFVLSRDLCGHDLEVFYPDDDDSGWTFIGAPSCFILKPFVWVKCHATVLDGFGLLINTNVVFYYNIPKKIWRIITESSLNFSFLQPRVFAHDISMWFYYCDDYLCGYHVDSNVEEVFKIGELPLLYFNYRHPLPLYYLRNDLLYLGDLMFCMVRTGSDHYRSWCGHPPAPRLQATIIVFRVDPSANAILEQRSATFHTDPTDLPDTCFCACFVI